jgi:hypothetical protein
LHILAGIGCDGGERYHDFSACWFVFVVGRDNETVESRNHIMGYGWYALPLPQS